MPVEIQLRADIPDYNTQTVLDGVVYSLNVRWNTRELAWYFDVMTETDDIIRAGIKVVTGYPLGLGCTDARFPPGVFVGVDGSALDQDPGPDDLGERVRLQYFPLGESPVF